jgi:hypothetical protein
MHALATTALLSLAAIAMALFSAPPADAAESLLADTRWEAFAGTAAPASLAWAGEDETFIKATAEVIGRPSGVIVDDIDLDVQSLAGLPAPEPPALVLAGMAFGGVLFGRSLLARRKRSPGCEEAAAGSAA